MKKTLIKFREYEQLHLFMLPGLLYLIIFCYLPMFGIQIAFKDYKVVSGIWGSEWIGLTHFATFFDSFYFERVIKNTLIISFYSLAVDFPMPILFALLLNIMREMRLKKFIQTVTYIPHFISTVVLVGMIKSLFSPVSGMYGNIYRLFSNGMYPNDLFGISNSFIHMYVWSGVWQGLGWNSIIYVAALSGVSAEMHEAATIDGANRWKRIWAIDLPSIMPTVCIMLILRCGSILSVSFEKVYLMQNSVNLKASEVIATYVYKEGLGKGSRGFSFGTAIGLFNSVVNFVMLALVNAITRKLSDDDASLW